MTVKKQTIFNFLCFIFMFVLLLPNNTFFTAKKYTTAEIGSNAKGMVVIEQSTHRILESKNCNVKLANASTTKIATFLTVLKHCNHFDEIVSVDDRAIGIEGTSIYLKKGEKLSVHDLLLGMMLVSGNDAATALALYISPSVEEFSKLMTNEAKLCGAQNTCFKNPHGLDESGHYTTAYDLALITAECYKYPIFEKVVSTKFAKIPNSEQGEFRFLKNKNKLLNTLEGCNGVKTGYTDDAGRCLVSSMKKDNLHLICVVLNLGPMFEESYSLLTNSSKKYKMCEILPPYHYLQNINLEGASKEVKVYTQKGFYYPLTKEEQFKIITKINILENLVAPLEKECIVGDLQIYLDNHLLFSEKIYTMEDVENKKVGSNLKRIVSEW